MEPPAVPSRCAIQQPGFFQGFFKGPPQFSAQRAELLGLIGVRGFDEKIREARAKPPGFVNKGRNAVAGRPDPTPLPSGG